MRTCARVAMKTDIQMILAPQETAAERLKAEADAREAIEGKAVVAAAEKEAEKTAAAADGPVAMSESEPEQEPEQEPAAEAGSASKTPPAVRKEFENDTGVYELAAILTHKGPSAEGGHYVAYTQYKGGASAADSGKHLHPHRLLRLCRRAAASFCSDYSRSR